MKVSEALERALAAIDTYGWTKDTLGSVAVGFCARGALFHVTQGGDVYRKAEGTLSRVIGNQSVPRWNDSRFRTKGQVRRAFFRAIDSARFVERLEAECRARREAERAAQRAEREWRMERLGPVSVHAAWPVLDTADVAHGFPLKR